MGPTALFSRAGATDDFCAGRHRSLDLSWLHVDVSEVFAAMLQGAHMLPTMRQKRSWLSSICATQQKPTSKQGLRQQPWTLMARQTLMRRLMQAAHQQRRCRKRLPLRPPLLARCNKQGMTKRYMR